jgi:leader peptidase (prepilin peptidase)/N-methyltransferase
MRYVAVILVAPFIGSFLGVLIARLPVGLPVVVARSRCETCERVLEAVDLVPLVSYAALRGRCRTCRAPIGGEHLAIELAALAVALWTLTVAVEPVRLWIDCGYFQLPDVLTLPLLLAGLVVTWAEMPEDLTDHAISAAVAYLGFRALAWVYRVVRGRDGLGQGDAKLLAAGGAWLGWEMLPDVILIAAVCGILVASVVAVRAGRLDGGMRIPFGPSISLSIWLMWLYG